MSFKVHDLVRIEGRGVFTVRTVDPLEGGGWGLTLEPPGGGACSFEEVYRSKFDGVFRTEQLDVVTPAAGQDLARQVEQGLKAAVGSSPPKTEPCRSCGAPIFWSESAKGKPVPTNPDGSSHFQTCPDAARWRGKKRGEAEVEPKPAAEEPQPEQLDLFG